MNAPLRVALVGYGFVGKVFHAPLIQATPGLVLHTVVSRDAGKVHADWPDVQVVGDPDAAFADPAVDVVVIASPNDSHAPLAMAALAQDKHVVVDKPFTVTLTEARDVVDAARRAGRLVSVFQNRRWDADFLTVQRLVGDGTLGRIAEFHSHFDRFRPVVQDRWREHDAPGGGLWYDLGPHLIDQAVQLFGLPEAISVDIARLRDGAQAPDYVHATLRYPTHRAHLHAGTLVAGNGLPMLLAAPPKEQATLADVAGFLQGVRPGQKRGRADHHQGFIAEGLALHRLAGVARCDAQIGDQVAGL